MLPLLLAACQAPSPEADAPIPPYDPLELVDPFLGTGGTGAQVTGLAPAANWPNGLVKVGPDTRHSVLGAPGFMHFGGYHADDDLIDGFSHTRGAGIGINDYGAILISPRTSFDAAATRSATRAAPFDPASEEASPGRYAVTFLNGVRAEVVAAPHSALHTWTFPAGSEPTLILDLGHSHGELPRGEDTWLQLDPASGSLEGTQRMLGGYSSRFGGLLTSFAVEVEPRPIAWGTWEDTAAPSPSAEAAAGPDAGAWLSFPPGTTTVQVRVGISYVDPAGARQNLRTELDGPADEALARVEEAWRGALGRVRVQGGTEAERVLFHTAHFRALQMPSRHDDADGRYRGWDQQIHQSPRPLYSDFSMWDTYRTLHPWLSLVHPDLQGDLLASVQVMTEQGGSVPRWPMAHGFTGGMVGTPADLIFTDAVLKGVGGFDEEAAWEAAWHHAHQETPTGRSGLPGYLERGYLTFQDASAPASRTLEYAWADAALAAWAEARGERTAASTFRARSLGWRGTVDPVAGTLFGRNDDGSFAPFEGMEAWHESFTEGNAWHYRWGAPWDLEGMALAYDGDLPSLVQSWEAYWDEVEREPDDDFPDTFYWHGNEPVLHYAALGALADAPELTHRAARWVLAHRYAAETDGWDGNDDGGTLAAWYLFAAIGLLPLPATDRYAALRPLFDRVEIDHPDGEVVITTSGPRDAAALGLSSGGTPLPDFLPHHRELLDGLQFTAP